MRLNLKNEKGIAKKTIIIIVAIIIVAIIIISSSGGNGYEMNVKNREEVAYATLRAAISKSRLDGSGTMSSEDFSKLGEMVKNADSENQWFASDSGVFYGDTADTSDYQVTWVSDGTYCAVFYAKLEGNTHYLTNYNFSPDDVKGYSILVGE